MRRGFLARLVERARTHRETRAMPRRIRTRIYRELLELREDERAVQQLLDLPIRPRISVVDEESIAVLRPSDRLGLGVDDALSEAREARAAARDDEG